jgi:hypothetical protein
MFLGLQRRPAHVKCLTVLTECEINASVYTTVDSSSFSYQVVFTRCDRVASAVASGLGATNILLLLPPLLTVSELSASADILPVMPIVPVKKY